MLTHLLDGDCQLSLKDSVQCWLGILPVKFTLSSRRKFAKEGGHTHISSLQWQSRAVRGTECFLLLMLLLYNAADTHWRPGANQRTFLGRRVTRHHTTNEVVSRP